MDDKKTIEQWATEKGMLPEKFVSPPAKPGAKKLPAPPRPNPKFGLYKQAKQHRGWPEGQEVTEEEFDAAVEEAGAVELR